MKHLIPTPRALLAALLALLMISPFGSRAQMPTTSQISTLDISSSTKNIIRQWKKYYVTYSYPNPSISLTNMTAPVGLAITTLLPSDVTVSDMQVANNTLFILGDEADTCGFVAYVNINDLVAGSPVFTVTRFPWVQYQLLYRDTFFVKFYCMDKLTVIDESSGSVAFTCKANELRKYHDNSVARDTMSCFAHYDFQSGNIDFVWDTIAEENFVDILFTGKVLVVLSEIPTKDSTYARLFLDNPLNLNSVYKDYATRISDGFGVLSSMMGEPVDTYRFAVAFHGTEISSSNTGAWIRDFAIVNNVINPSALGLSTNVDFAYLTNRLDLKCFAYNKLSKLYCLLMSINGYDQIIEHVVGNTSIRINNFGCRMEDLHSNDNYSYTAFVGVGQSAGEVYQFVECQSLISHCLSTNISSMANGQQQVKDMHCPLLWNTTKYTSTLWQCSSFQTPAQILCTK